MEYLTGKYFSDAMALFFYSIRIELDELYSYVVQHKNTL